MASHSLDLRYHWKNIWGIWGRCQLGSPRGARSPAEQFHSTKHCLTPAPPSKAYNLFVFIQTYNLVPWDLQTHSNACTVLIHSKLMCFMLFEILQRVIHHLGKSCHEGNNTHVPLPERICSGHVTCGASIYGHKHQKTSSHLQGPSALAFTSWHMYCFIKNYLFGYMSMVYSIV